MKWFLVALIASTAVPANAATEIVTGLIGSHGSMVDLTFDSDHEIWSFKVLDPLPPDLPLQPLSLPNQWFIFDRSTDDLLDLGVGPGPNFAMRTLSSSHQEWQVELWFADTSVKNIVWWNAAWQPLPDNFPAPEVIARFELTAEELPAIPEPASWAMMILGFGLVGAALRRRTAAMA